MHLYWKIQNDLNCLGEVIQFTDPVFIRSLQQWVRKHWAGLTMAGDVLLTETLLNHLN